MSQAQESGHSQEERITNKDLLPAPTNTGFDGSYGQGFRVRKAARIAAQNAEQKRRKTLHPAY